MERSDIANAIRRCKGNEFCSDKDCPFARKTPFGTWYSTDCIRELYDEILTIMEPVEVEIEGGCSSYWEVCGECHVQVGSYDKFCRMCGRPLNRS